MPTAPNQTLLSLLQSDTAKLAQNPKDIPLRTKILKNQVSLTSAQLGISSTEASNTVRTFTAAYAKSNGLDPKAIIEALTTEEQKILNYSKSNPTLYGVNLITANKIAGYLGLGSGFLLSLALTAFVISAFTIGPEVAAGIVLGEGLVAALTSLFTVAATTTSGSAAAIGGGLFLLSQMLGHLSSGIPMMTKQMIDNGSIGPGLRISAIKEAEDVLGKLSGSSAPGPFTSAQFTSYATGIETQGVLAINDPDTKQIVTYSRQALAKLIIWVYGQSIVNGNKSTYSTIVPLLTHYLVFQNKTIPAAAKSPIIISAPAAAPSIKVFTGVVSQGVLGSATSFQSRPDDLISNIDELKQAVENNLAPFIASIGSKIVYEVKIQSTVTGANGFILHGTSHQVQTGVSAAGVPRYKTVVNKFAVLNLYLLTDKGNKSKITSITLGPTDAINFQPEQNALTQIEATIKTDLFSSNPAIIQNIAQNNSPQASLANVFGTSSTTSHTPAPSAPAPKLILDSSYFVDREKHYDTLFHLVGDTVLVYNPYQDLFTQEEKAALAQDSTKYEKIPAKLLEHGVDVAQFSVTPFIADVISQHTEKSIATFGEFFKDATTIPQVATNTIDRYEIIYNPTQNQWSIDDKLTATTYYYSSKEEAQSFFNTNNIQIPAPKNDAQTLFQYYTNQSRPLPPLAERAALYQSLGLGTATLYVGTAEQNTKLLGALKARG